MNFLISCMISIKDIQTMIQTKKLISNQKYKTINLKIKIVLMAKIILCLNMIYTTKIKKIKCHLCNSKVIKKGLHIKKKILLIGQKKWKAFMKIKIKF